MSSDDGDEPGLSRSRDDFGAPVPKHRCDHCGSATGITYPYDWPGRPDGIWLHRQCEALWFDSEDLVVDWSEIKAIAGSRRHDISNATQGGSHERQSNDDGTSEAVAAGARE